MFPAQTIHLAWTQTIQTDHCETAVWGSNSVKCDVMGTAFNHLFKRSIKTYVVSESEALHGDVKERKGKEEYLYSAFCTKVHTKRSGMDHTVLPANNTMPAFPSWRSSDVTTTATEAADR